MARINLGDDKLAPGRVSKQWRNVSRIVTDMIAEDKDPVPDSVRRQWMHKPYGIGEDGEDRRG